MKKLAFSNFHKKTRYHVNKDMNPFWRIKDLVDDKYGRVLDFDVFLPTKGVNLQRDFVWTEHQKSEFILSLLKELDCGKLHLVDHEHTTFQVIDGKQRISTAISFIKGEFPITYKGHKFFYNDLDGDCQHTIDSWSPRGNIGYSYDNDPITDDEKIEWFLRVNFTGTVQDEKHHELLDSKLSK